MTFCSRFLGKRLRKRLGSLHTLDAIFESLLMNKSEQQKLSESFVNNDGVLLKIRKISELRQKKVKLLIGVCAARCSSLVCHDDEENQHTPDRQRNIDSFSNSHCKLFFQFHKDHLILLVSYLKFPAICILNITDLLLNLQYREKFQSALQGDK
jgi:hypothetical protein